MKSKIIFTFLLVSIVIILFFLYYLIIGKHDVWILGDWVINYQDGGFKRRGIVGSILIEINKLLLFRIDYQVFILNSLLWILYIFFFYELIKKINISWGLFFLILSPVVFLFNVSSTSAIGRKEIVLFFLFSLWIYLSLFKKVDKKIDFLFIFLLSFLIYVHELVMFFSPYFFIFYLIKNKKIDSYFVFSLFLIIMNSLVIYFYGGEINQGKTYYILENECGLVIEKGGIIDVKSKTNYLGEYFAKPYAHISYLIIFVTYYLFSMKVLFESIDRRKYNSINILFFLFLNQFFVLALFYLATDWGRWININFVLITLLILFFENSSKLSKDSFNNIYVKTLGLIFLFLQIETCGLGLKPNYYLEILLSKIL